MTDTSAGTTVPNGQITGFGTKGYRSYVLIALMLIYTLNFIDRTLISVVAQPIILRPVLCPDGHSHCHVG